MKIETIKSGAPRPLANYNECFQGRPLGFCGRPDRQRLQDRSGTGGAPESSVSISGIQRFHITAPTSSCRPIRCSANKRDNVIPKDHLLRRMNVFVTGRSLSSTRG